MAIGFLEGSNQIVISGYEYRVRLWDDFEIVHIVTKSKTCSCGEKNCAAIRFVADYLKAGGNRAPDPVNLSCPICGGKTTIDRGWKDTVNGNTGFGWRCENGGISHWMKVKTNRIHQGFTAHPWLFPPVYDNAGTCVYEGVRRNAVMTWEECQEINRRVFQETGYDPTA